LTPHFLEEIFKLMFVNKKFLEMCRTHLEFQFIPKELPEFKFILKSIFSQFDLDNKLPLFGVVSQQYANNLEVQSALAKIKQTDIVPIEKATKQLESYLKNVKFQLLYDQVYGLYNKDERRDEAFALFEKGAQDLASFSLMRDSGQVLRVFSDFKTMSKEAQSLRMSGSDYKEKVPFNIDPLDILTDDGMDVGDTALFIARSGVGKSTVLKWVAMSACRIGYDVLHIQLEGSRKEAFDKYTQLWTGSTYNEARWADFPKEKRDDIDRALKSIMKRQHDIEIFSFERFGSATMREIRDVIMDYYKRHGKFPDLITIDSLDLAYTGENKKIDNDPEYKKDRLQRVAQRMKDVAVEFKTRILTVTQTCDVPKEFWNNPNKVLDRSHTEGDRTLVKPFAHVFTINQTIDERKAGVIRLNVDKLRYYDIKDAVYPIYSAYEQGKFYDRARSLRELNQEYDKCRSERKK